MTTLAIIIATVALLLALVVAAGLHALHAAMASAQANIAALRLDIATRAKSRGKRGAR
jgi:hypothetical protein